MGEGLSLEKKSRGMRVRKDPSGTRGTHLSGGGRMRELQLFGAGWALNHYKGDTQCSPTQGSGKGGSWKVLEVNFSTSYLSNHRLDVPSGTFVTPTE